MNVQRNKNWNEQLVTEEIRAWQELGKPLYSHYMRQNYQELLAAGIRYFGTWRSALDVKVRPLCWQKLVKSLSSYENQLY